MPDHIDPSDPTESTEARLCAYLEGTLSPAERTEIEAYLARSPEHRVMLADLAATRTWLSELPRVSAPPEIAELFESQVERTMLLDDSASAVSIRINRGPQVMLAAAVVLLALGLGAIIYLVLMVHGPTAQNYASSMRPAPTPAPPTPPLIGSAPVQHFGVLPATAQVQREAAGGVSPLADTAPSPSAFAKASATTAPAPVAMSAVRFQAPASMLPAMSRAVTRPTTATFAAASPPPATEPGVAAVGDRLSVDIPQLVGPGVEKTTTVRVEPDGSVTLPMLDSMPAAGKTFGDLQKQIADRYRQEHLIATPVVTVTRLPGPTSAPATMPTTQPTTRAVVSPSTMPATRRAP